MVSSLTAAQTLPRVPSLLLALIGTIFLAACDGRPRIVVASKNFTEQVILGEIIAQHLEHRLDVRIERRLNLGGTLLAHEALVTGGIDLYPEYTGTALTAILNLPPSKDPTAVFGRVQQEYRNRWRVEWLPPLGVNNTFAMVIRGDEARRGKFRTISEAAKRKQGWRMGMGYEFQQRPDGLAGLMETYDLALAGPVKTMDLGLLYRALEQGDVDMLSANSTDGMLSVLDVRVLTDDKRYFPPYEAAIAVRAEALEAHPGLRQALAELSGTLSDEAMQRLNYEIDGKHRPEREVAKEFLRTQGLVSSSLLRDQG